MRNQNSFAYPCFSEECGFCSHCCGIPYEYPDSEEMHRADTNCQFYESQLPELTKSYYLNIIILYFLDLVHNLKSMDKQLHLPNY